MQQELETLKKWIDNSDNIVFFGGAGVSTESGIPDFRSVDGLYNQQYDYPPETQKSFIDSTGLRCWHWMQSPMQHTRSWLNGNRKAS